MAPENPPVPSQREYCTVVTSSLNNHRLLFAGEVDCCDPANRQRYIELKTNRIFTKPSQEQNFGKFKAMRLWAQSFLVGVPEIVVGFRDDEGIVRRLQSYQTTELPRLSGGVWDPGMAFTFLNRLLDFIKENVTIEDPRRVCLFPYDPHDQLIRTEHVAGPSQWTFLPDWYVDKFSDLTP